LAQNRARVVWRRDTILKLIDEYISAAFANVYEESSERKIYTRDAAFLVAINSVVRANRMCGRV
jgi:glutamate dehydrogenase